MIIEETVRNYLDDMLTVPVLLQRVEKLTEPYVMIEKTGGSKTDYINHATIALQSYGASIHIAADLNEQVKTAMAGIVQLETVSSARLDTDYNFTDQSRDEYRYQAVFDIAHY